MVEKREQFKAETDRIINLLPQVNNVEIDSEKEIIEAGFIDKEDYNFIKLIKEHIDMHIAELDNSQESIERQRSIVKQHLLKAR